MSVPSGGVAKRFLQLAEVAAILDVSLSQVYALVRSRRLRAIKIGGRGQYRVEASELEDFIARSYAETEAFLQAHPFSRDLSEEPDEQDLTTRARTSRSEAHGADPGPRTGSRSVAG